MTEFVDRTMIGARVLIRSLLALLIASSLSSQAFNALREPKRSVFQAFPEASGYKQIIRPVTQADRVQVLKLLPFRIHFNELGDHAVYAALRDERPIGIVHARSEEGRWGFVEIAWALDLDMRVRGFKFHRCRSKHRNALERSPFSTSLHDLDRGELEKLLTSKNEVRSTVGGIPRGARRLAGVVVRSAIKTISLTQVAWRRDIRQLRAVDLGLSAIPGGKSVHILTEYPLSTGASQAPPAIPGDLSPGKLGPGVRMIRAVDVRDLRNKRLGQVVESSMQHGSIELLLRWTLEPSGRVRRVVPVRQGWPDSAIRATFTGLEGRIPPAEQDCEGVVDLMARRIVSHVRDLIREGDRRR